MRRRAVLGSEVLDARKSRTPGIRTGVLGSTKRPMVEKPCVALRRSSETRKMRNAVRGLMLKRFFTELTDCSFMPLSALSGAEVFGSSDSGCGNLGKPASCSSIGILPVYSVDVRLKP